MMDQMFHPATLVMLTCACTAFACAPTIEVGELDTHASTGEDTSHGSSSATTGGSSAGPPTGAPQTDVGGPEIDPSEIRKMDILLVMDNSGSMGPRQARVVDMFSAMVATLEQAEVDFDWRLGITTTDNGNPWCEGTGPEGGSLRASSCRERLQEFTFAGTEFIDVSAAACTDQCVLDTLPLLPTSIPEDPEPRIRPWIDWGCNQGFDTQTLERVLACAVPQGINGCGFEQPLESMRKAIERSQVPSEPSFGFIRDDAHLMVLFVTDEADCSHNPDATDIFLPDGTRTFWDDGWISPLSAVCWRAGVRCTGEPSDLDCVESNYDIFGDPTTDPEQIAMTPVSSYLDALEAVQANKIPGARVFTLGITGTPISGGPPHYADAFDPQFAADYGIGPGCQTPEESAVPPVRMVPILEAFSPTPGAWFSICDSDYASVGAAMIGLLGEGSGTCP